MSSGRVLRWSRLTKGRWILKIRKVRRNKSISQQKINHQTDFIRKKKKKKKGNCSNWCEASFKRKRKKKKGRWDEPLKCTDVLIAWPFCSRSALAWKLDRLTEKVWMRRLRWRVSWPFLKILNLWGWRRMVVERIKEFESEIDIFGSRSQPSDEVEKNDRSKDSEGDGWVWVELIGEGGWIGERMLFRSELQLIRFNPKVGLMTKQQSIL